MADHTVTWSQYTLWIYWNLPYITGRFTQRLHRSVSLQLTVWRQTLCNCTDCKLFTIEIEILRILKFTFSSCMFHTHMKTTLPGRPMLRRNRISHRVVIHMLAVFSNPEISYSKSFYENPVLCSLLLIWQSPNQVSLPSLLSNSWSFRLFGINQKYNASFPNESWCLQ